MVETESDEILRDADKENVALLVVGDPFGWVYAVRVCPACLQPLSSGLLHTLILFYELVLSGYRSESFTTHRL